IEQRRGKRGEVDRTPARTLEGNPVEQDRGLVRARSSQRQRRRLAWSAERVHRDARRSGKQLRDGADLARKTAGLDDGSFGGGRPEGSVRPLRDDLDLGEVGASLNVL